MADIVLSSCCYNQITYSATSWGLSTTVGTVYNITGDTVMVDGCYSIIQGIMPVIVQTLNGVAASVGNMNMTHQVNIGGEVNVNGINAKNIAENIKMEVGNMIVQTVKDVLNRAANNTSKRDTEAI